MGFVSRNQNCLSVTEVKYSYRVNMLRTLGMRVGARVSLVLARSLRLLHSVCLNLSNLPCMYEHTATYCSVRAFGFRLSRVIRSPVGDQLSLSSRHPFSCSLKQEVNAAQHRGRVQRLSVLD